MGADVGGDLDFSGAQLQNVGTNHVALIAERTKVGGDFFFSNVKADGKVDLKGSAIAHNLELRDIRTPQKIDLDLRLVKAGALVDNIESWPPMGNLHLDGFIYDEIEDTSNVFDRIIWLELQKEFSPEPYEQLASVFRKTGHDWMANQVLISKNKDYTESLQKKSPTRFLYRFFGIILGYGYEPWRAFGLSLAFISFGFFITQFAFDRQLILPKDEKDCNFNKYGTPHVSKNYLSFNSFIYSLEMFVPLVNLGMNDAWRSYANRRARVLILGRRYWFWGSTVRAYMWVHVLAGWVLTTLWVGGLTGLIKT
jgi:hypothetical protein